MTVAVTNAMEDEAIRVAGRTRFTVVKVRLTWELPAAFNRIVDGDTFWATANVVDEDFKPRSIRLARIQAPERGEPGADEATTWLLKQLMALPPGDTLLLRPSGLDNWRRWVSEAYHPTAGNLSDGLLAARLAKPYRTASLVVPLAA